MKVLTKVGAADMPDEERRRRLWQIARAISDLVYARSCKCDECLQRWRAAS